MFQKELQNIQYTATPFTTQQNAWAATQQRGRVKYSNNYEKLTETNIS